ncbi:MAG: coproporphyrinogen III oxidase family protein [Candidatus Latescibacterota bacterium]|nr:MAG: coproporphyrinogen III oxidase family protein [Candidatus Latescibacterota bacterium]
MDFGVYVHVPFCRRQCAYCTFFTLPRPEREAEMSRFLDAVWVEWQLRVKPRLDRGHCLRTLYLGGGTPSDLPPRALGTFLQRLGASVPAGLKALEEVTVECNPESATPPTLDRLRAGGVGRISLGVQSVHPEDLRRLGRRATPRQIEAALDAVAARFPTWNADLILGIPGSNERRLLAALDVLAARRAPHLSLYCLELPRARAEIVGDPQTEASEAAKTTLYELASHWLSEHGYEHYEISNAALPGHAARHNTAYWAGREYVGLGPGAHSFEGQTRRANRADLGHYVAALNSGSEPPAQRQQLSAAERWRESVLLGLRRRRGVDLDELGLQAQQAWIEALCRQGLAELQGSRLWLLPRGWLVMDSIVLQMVTAAEERPARLTSGSRPRYIRPSSR